MIVVGLTGSIGMGKSTVSRSFVSYGAVAWDADQAVHQLMDVDGLAVKLIGTEFPESKVKKSGFEYIDRNILGRMIFDNVDLLRRLESIIHPLVHDSRKQFLAIAKQQRCSLVILDIPLLFETAGDLACDATVVASAPEFVQKARVLRRKNMTEEKFKSILKHQMSDLEKCRRADFVVKTGQSYRFSHKIVGDIVRELSAHETRFGQKKGALNRSSWGG